MTFWPDPMNVALASSVNIPFSAYTTRVGAVTFSPLLQARSCQRVDDADHDVGIEPRVVAVAALFEVLDPRVLERTVSEELCCGRLGLERNRPGTKEISQPIVRLGLTSALVTLQENQFRDQVGPRGSDEHRCVCTHRLSNEGDRTGALSLDHLHAIADERGSRGVTRTAGAVSVSSLVDQKHAMRVERSGGGKKLTRATSKTMQDDHV